MEEAGATKARLKVCIRSADSGASGRAAQQQVYLREIGRIAGQVHVGSPL